MNTRRDLLKAAGIVGISSLAYSSNLPNLPSHYLRKNFYISTSGAHYPDAVLHALSAIGPDRVIYATDYPMEDLADVAEGIYNLPVSNDIRRKIFEENATRLFKLQGALS